MDENDHSADQQALEYARAYTQKQLGDAPAEVQAQYIQDPAQIRQKGGDNGKTVRTLIVVAGLVVVAWIWIKNRKG